MTRISGMPTPPPMMATTPTSPGVVQGLAEPSQSQFKNFLVESLQQVNSLQADADQAVETMMTGGDVNPAQVLTAVQKADLTFRLMMQIRNKLVSAYQEVKDVRI